ncbi:MAG: arginine deiminase [Candidatus Izimaplasma sp.]|nr:arginine deiminase [Candidatus Izimaplasma bacterium]
MKINVFSEIGRLRTVLLHRPGKELENLTPDLLQKLLFDDIPYLKKAQQEHDAFANALREEGVEVLYIKELMVETLDHHKEVKSQFINQFIEESHILSRTVKNTIYAYLIQLDHAELVNKVIEGIRTHDVEVTNHVSIIDLLEDEYPFYTDPLPNLIFQRDPFVSLGEGVVINNMMTEARQRETLFSEYIFKYHPRFEKAHLPKYNHRGARYKSEGGDFIVLNKETLLIGISQRTDPRAIEHIAAKIFRDNTSFKQVIAVNMPKSRAFMHLDTVFTQVDHDMFTVHPHIIDQLSFFEVTRGHKDVKVTKLKGALKDVLERYLKKEVTLINCGGTDLITSGREQWNDGANTLAVAPGVVVVYERNHVTNEALREAGIKVIEIPSSELSRGRGGPRCMSMPLYRDSTKL